MTEDEARAYVLAYINGVRRLNGVPPLVRDLAVDAFAQAGSEELSRDHQPNQHMFEHNGEMNGSHAEVQGPPEGSLAGPLQDRIGEILLRWMGEEPEGSHRAILMRPEWRKIGVGIVTSDGRVYFTSDFSSF
jgi:uncharacterized protein YkwD